MSLDPTDVKHDPKSLVLAHSGCCSPSNTSILVMQAVTHEIRNHQENMKRAQSHEWAFLIWPLAEERKPEPESRFLVIVLVRFGAEI